MTLFRRERPVPHQNASACEITDLRAIRAICHRGADLVIENLALRQQLAVLKKERPRPPLGDTDRALWVALRKSWPGCPLWMSRLVIVNADTVARWNRHRFHDTGLGSPRGAIQAGLVSTPRFVELIRMMAQDGWGRFLA